MSNVNRAEPPAAKADPLNVPAPFSGLVQAKKNVAPPARTLPPPTVQVPPRREAAPPERQRGVSGPSFLGLSDPAPIPSEDLYDEDGKYYGDDLYKSNWGGRATLLLVVLLVLAGLGYLQWRSDHPLRSVLQAGTPAADSGAIGSASSPAKDSESKKEEQIAASAAPAAAAPTAAPAQPQTAPPATTAEPVKKEEDNATPASTPAAGLEDKKKTTTPAAGSDAAESSAKKNSQESSAAADNASAADSGNDAEPAKASEQQSPAESKAVRAGNEEQVKLAETYLEGRGVPKNCDEGVGILRAASNRGNTQAVIKLGALYATGSCVPLDRVTAYHYFSRAFEVQPTNSFLEHNRTMLWANMSEEERQRALAQDGDLGSH